MSFAALVANPILYAGISLSITLIAFFYMLFKLTNIPEFQGRANIELNELFITIAIIIAVPIFEQAMISIIPSLANNANLFEAARGVVHGYITTLVKNTVLLYAADGAAGFFAMAQPEAPIFHIGVAEVELSFALSPGLDIVLEMLNKIIDFYEIAIGIQILQYIGLYLIEFTVPSVVFTLGIVLRSIPFTRTTGSTVIAFSLALYFLYPLSIIMVDHIINSYEEGYANSLDRPIFDTYIDSLLVLIPEDYNLNTDPENTLSDWQSIINNNLLEGDSLEPGHINDYSNQNIEVIEQIEANKEENGEYKVPSIFTKVTDYLFSFLGIPLHVYKLALAFLPYSFATIVSYSFSFVINFIVLISGFRSFAETIRGEGNLIGLSRLV